MMMQRRILFLWIVCAGMLVACSNSDALPALSNTYRNPTAFNFNYPEGWEYSIPVQGLLILGEPQTLEGTPGPTFTVQRSLQLAQSESLEAALETYLRRGPLREDRFWTTTEEITTVEFNGRDALRTTLQGADFDDAPQADLTVIATKVEDGPTYFFIVAIPLDDLEQYEAIMDAILDTVEIVE